MLYLCYNCAIKYKRNISPKQEKMRKISPVKERILQYLDYKNISVSKFYSETGISRSTLIKPSGASEETIAKTIATYRDISLIWLLTGKGEMIKNEDYTDESVVSEKEIKYSSKNVTKRELINALEEAIKKLKGEV